MYRFPAISHHSRKPLFRALSLKRGSAAGSGSFKNQFAFFAPLTSSIVLARGTGSPTFTRATVATVDDWESRTYSVISGEVRFKGARRVQNLVNTKSEDWTNAAWTKTIGTVTATTLTSTGANQTVIMAVGATGTFDCVMRIRMSRITGVGNIDLTLDGGATWTTVVLTATAQVFSISQAAVATPKPGIRIVTATDAINADQVQLENTLGHSNTNPSEYVSVGVLSAPYNGANVDAVRYLEVQNGNTVAANVVTEANGTAILPTTLLGYLPEQASTNLCLQSENFGTTWAAVGTPTRVAANDRCGTVVLDLIGDDSAAALEGYTQTVTFTGNAVKAVSIYIKAGTSTSTAIRLRDTTAPADRLLVVLAWAGGMPTPTATTGTVLGTDALGNSVYRVRMLTTSVTATNVNSLQVYPATDAALSVANTGTVNAGGVQAEDQAIRCTSYLPTTTGTVARAVDILSYQNASNLSDTAGTCYAEAKTDYFVSTQVVGTGTAGASYLLQLNSATVIAVKDGTNTVTGAVSDVSIAMRKIASTWGTALKVYGDGAPAGSGAYDGAFGATLIYIGQAGVGGGQALNGTVRNVKIWTVALTDLQVAQLP